MRNFTREEIRRFFTRRPYLRPADWGIISSRETSEDRHMQLVWFVNGYRNARWDWAVGNSDAYPDAEPEVRGL